MSALRAHFQSSSSQRPSKTSTAKSPATKDGSTRQSAKLAKKNSKLPISADTSSRGTKLPSAGLAVPETRSIASATTLHQLRDQMQASASPRGVLSPPPMLRTPSLISGSSASTHDSPRSNVLRRKPSTIGSFVAKQRSEADRSATHSRNGYADTMEDSVFGIVMPPTHNHITPSTTPHNPALMTERHDNAAYAPANTIISNTPSTRYTDSPFSHVPTPSSFSSISTAPQPVSSGSKLSQELSRERAISPRTAITRSTSIAAKDPSKQAGKTSRLSYTKPVQNGKTTSVGRTSSQSSLGVSTQAKAAATRSIVPELAHLNELSPQRLNKQLPARPSRDGATGPTPSHVASPVVQSDLTPATFHKRTSSRESYTSASSSFRSHFGLSPKLSLDHGSPLIDSGISGRITPSVPNKSPPQSQSPAQTTSASPAPPKTHRFGMFMRKVKNETGQKLEKPIREPRKMPAAGTGHERYGRFGITQRNGSVGSATGTRSPSTDSASSNKTPSLLRRKSSSASDKTSELDEFLRDRLNPVVLRGSGSNFSNTTSASAKSRPESIDGVASEAQVGLAHTPALPQTSFQQSHLNRASVRLAELARPDPPESTAVPETRITQEAHNARLAYSHTSSSSSSELPKAMDAKEGLWLRPLAVENKPARKWNFLQRLQSSPTKTRTAAASADRTAVIDPNRGNLDNAAHCALLDSINPIELDEIEKLVHEIEGQHIATSVPVQPQHASGDNRRRSLLPSPPDISRASVKRYSGLAAPQREPLVSSARQSGEAQRPNAVNSLTEDRPTLLRTPELVGDRSPRVPRLSPVGRIPRVVSKRDQDRKLPDKSFSRPFASTQPRPNVKPPGALYTQIRDLASPVEPAVHEFPPPPGHDIAQKRPSRNGDSTLHSATNLFSFLSRKNSDFSYSSSSDAASQLAYARMQALQDEDIWDEYDDLVNDASLGKPSTYHKASISPHQSSPYRELSPIQDASYFGVPPTREPRHALPRLPRPAREGSNANVKQNNKPGSQTSDNSIYNMTRAAFSRNSAMSTTTVDSSRNSRTSIRSRTASVGEANVRSSHTSFSSAGRDHRDSIKSPPTAQNRTSHASVNLKLEALTTSKMLSFGRVLFSPAHNEIQLADEPRVLILDGLGSDWSYFVAMFYPRAKVFNLGPSGRQGPARDGHQQMPNHRNIAYPVVGAPLPFPKGFFTAAVFRYPVATTDQAYASCITEFKRVLKPGGHLEVTVLDIDLDNSGSGAKQAVRGIKIRLQQRQEKISLRSLGDFVLQLIGKRGFEEVQRCIIGLPVMCRSSRSSDAGSTGSDASTARSPNTEAASSESKGRAIANLVEQARTEQGDSALTSDEKMTSSVARVGRYFYTQCYESLLNDKSIFNDQALLQECQAQGTSFRLLICYAQKPTQARRRTMSV